MTVEATYWKPVVNTTTWVDRAVVSRPAAATSIGGEQKGRLHATTTSMTVSPMANRYPMEVSRDEGGQSNGVMSTGGVRTRRKTVAYNGRRQDQSVREGDMRGEQPQRAV